jgi:hypothetical protein
MRYQKPVVLLSGPALKTIQGSLKVDNEDQDSPNTRGFTMGAYEADE